MLKQDLNSHQDQHDTADPLRLALKACAEEVADPHTQHGEGKRDYTDEGDGGDNTDLQESKRDAHSQRINTGGHGHREHGAGREGGIDRLGLSKGFLDHVGADQREQHEGDPMVDTQYIRTELLGKQIAKKRHSRLKAAKVQAGNNGMSHLKLSNGQALTHGHRHGVHRKTDS